MSRTLDYANRQAREGRAIRRDREALSLSQAALAQRAGISTGAVHVVEHGGGSDRMRSIIRNALASAQLARTLSSFGAERRASHKPETPQ